MKATTKLAAFTLASSLLTGCATMEGAKQDVGKIFGGNNPTPTEPAPAASAASNSNAQAYNTAAQAKAPLVNPNLAASIEKAAAAQRVNLSGADVEAFYRREAAKASSGVANSYSPSSVQNQAAGAAGGALNVLKEKMGTAGRVLSAPIDRTTRVPVQQGQYDQQFFAALKGANDRVNAGMASPDAEANNLVRLYAAQNRGRNRLIESGTNEMIREGSDVLIEKTLPKPKGTGGAFGDLLNKVIPK